MAKENEVVFAFDFGTSSLGESVRKGDGIVEKASLIIDENVGKIAEQRKRRRAFRTRESHRAREASLQKHCSEAGIPILAHDDHRMKREFPKQGDETCYTSSLLRIKLLRGENLEGWQIYKALHSAIQRRGYDHEVPWKTDSRNKEKEEEKEFDKKVQEFEAEFSRLPDGCRYPCYFDAWKMGLWDPKKDTFRLRIDCRAERARNWLIPRSIVLNEVKALLQAAERFFPKLKGLHEKILFGEGRKEYASYFAELRKLHGLRRGAKSDLDGIMGQKVPRFDNRIIGKCVLMPRRNVCRTSDGLVRQVRFLLQLKNMRFERNGCEDMLSPKEMSKLLQSIIDSGKKKRDKDSAKSTKTNPFKRTAKQWKKFVEGIGGIPKSAEDEIKPPSIKGRARFCRPALRLLRELLTTGISPRELHDRCKRQIDDGSLQLNADDIAFLEAMPQTWESFYIPDSRLDALLANAGGDANRAIVNLIGGQTDPVVRHRLFFFYQELRRMRDKHGVPDKVALEFVRDDFMGKKAKQKYKDFIKEKTRDNYTAREELEKYDLDPNSSKNCLKMKLFMEQGGRCLYTGAELSERLLDSYDIDHIVPRSRDGSDSYLNFTLTEAHTNRKLKQDRTPYEWLRNGSEWEAYKNRVEQAKISKKKKRLLMAENAAELDKKYTTLAETAWIAKLARKIVCLCFNWPEGKPDQPRKCQIISGGLTARIRARYHLNEILTPKDLPPEEREKKYRLDDRHHALDAMVLSYIPNWAADKPKRGFFEFPQSMGNPARYFSEQIAEVIPETVFREKPKLEETFYGKRIIDGNEKMVYTREMKDIPYKTVKQKKVFKPQPNGQDAEQIVDKRICREVKETLIGLSSVPDKEQQERIWLDYVANYRLPGPDGGGPRVIKVACDSGDPREYKELRLKSPDNPACRNKPKGQYRKGDKHHGYFIITDGATTKVEPVYAFESLTLKRKAMLDKHGDNARYFFSGCLVVVDNEAKASETKKGEAKAIKSVIKPGVYKCNSITVGNKIRLQKGDSKFESSLSTFLRANPDFRQYKRKE